MQRFKWTQVWIFDQKAWHHIKMEYQKITTLLDTTPDNIPLTLTWSENCVLTDITTQAARNANPNADPPLEARERINAPTNTTFKITDTKLYVPVVTLSIKDDNSF